MASGDKTSADLQKYGMAIRDYTDGELKMKRDWTKKNKVGRAKVVSEPSYPNNKMTIKGY